MPRKRAGKRAETWEIKTKPELLHPLLSSRHREMVNSIRKAYTSIDMLYGAVAEILDREGIHTQFRLLYRSYMQEIIKLTQKYTSKALEKQINAIKRKYIDYGLDSELLTTIAELVFKHTPVRKAGKRAETWEIKTKPELLHPVLASRHREMVNSIRKAYTSIDMLYESITNLLDSRGVFAQSRLLYRSFVEELYKLSQKYTSKALEKQATTIYNKYVDYGADPDILSETAKLVGVKIIPVVVVVFRLDYGRLDYDTLG